MTVIWLQFSVHLPHTNRYWTSMITPFPPPTSFGSLTVFFCPNSFIGCMRLPVTPPCRPDDLIFLCSARFGRGEVDWNRSQTGTLRLIQIPWGGCGCPVAVPPYLRASPKFLSLTNGKRGCRTEEPENSCHLRSFPIFLHPPPPFPWLQNCKMKLNL